MRLFFWRRRALSDFADAIRPELTAIETPEPPAQLLERILATRAASGRVILPEPVIVKPRAATRGIVIVAIAASALLLLFPSIRRVPNGNEEVVASSMFFTGQAFAQPVTARTGLAPVAFTRPDGIRPLALEFSRRVRSGTGDLVSESRDTLVVAAADVEGTPAWQVVSSRHEVVASQRRTEAETLYVARADLRVLRRAVHVSPYLRFARINVVQHFRGDSVTGRMTTDGPSIGAGRAIARRLAPELAPYLTGAFAPAALMAAPLSATWSGSISLLGWAVIPRDVFVPVELRVEGEERITVPAGTFDCWRLSIRFGGQEVTYWVRKSDGLGVRVFDRRDGPATESRETVLTRVSE
jgi:hypothetical protein